MFAKRTLGPVRSALIATAFLMLNTLPGMASTESPPEACKPEVLQDRMVDCSFWDWLERWQTLVGSAIAVVSAVVVSYPVFRGMRENSRQAAATAAGTLRQVVAPLEAELVAHTALRPDVWALRVPSLRNGRFTIDPKKAVSEKQLAAARAALVSMHLQLSTCLRQNPEPGEMADLRTALFQHVLILETQVTQFFIEVSDEDVLPVDGRDVINEAQRSLAMALNGVAESYVEWEAAADAYSAKLRTDVTALWTKIHEMERRATSVG
ncbi:hypothetical protein [Kaistia sp. MMO-174]|uniref:hypothetical protein n=1 Tax=Kaistia sp. MMO-174 TaxID=3081256 RepID=UPI0030179140